MIGSKDVPMASKFGANPPKSPTVLVAQSSLAMWTLLAARSPYRWKRWYCWHCWYRWKCWYRWHRPRVPPWPDSFAGDDIPWTALYWQNALFWHSAVPFKPIIRHKHTQNTQKINCNRLLGKQNHATTPTYITLHPSPPSQKKTKKHQPSTETP